MFKTSSFKFSKSETNCSATFVRKDLFFFNRLLWILLEYMKYFQALPSRTITPRCIPLFFPPRTTTILKLVIKHPVVQDGSGNSVCCILMTMKYLLILIFFSLFSHINQTYLFSFLWHLRNYFVTTLHRELRSQTSCILLNLSIAENSPVLITAEWGIWNIIIKKLRQAMTYQKLRHQLSWCGDSVTGWRILK